MNQKIRELAERVVNESELYCVHKFDLTSDVNQFFAEVFAQLIVQDCLELVEKWELFLANTPSKWTALGAVEDLGDDIREYFGIEE